MTVPAPADIHRITAELVGEALVRAAGQPGVLIRDLPQISPDSLFPVLEALVRDGHDLRLAYIGMPEDLALGQELEPDHVSSLVEQAEAWRNQRDLSALIVVVASEDAAKLTSLEEFVNIGPAQLRNLLVDRAIARFGELNEVLPRWWTIVGADQQISFSDLLDYYATLEPLDGDALRLAAASEINRLGLLPDPAFFDGPSVRQLRQRSTDNRLVALRLANFSEEDRIKADKALAAESNLTRRAELRARLRDLQLFRRGGEVALTLADGQQLLRLRAATPPTPPTPTETANDAPPPPDPPNPPRNLAALAVDHLLAEVENPDEDSDFTSVSLDLAVEQLRAQLEEIDASAVRPAPVGITLPSGYKLDDTVATDVLNAMSQLLGEGEYGALLRTVETDPSAMFRSFQQSAETIRSWSRALIDEYLEAFYPEPKAGDVRYCFEAYDTARNELLPHLREMIVAPLLLATAPATRDLLVALLETYSALLESVELAHGELHATYGDDARALIESLMLIDTVFFEGSGELIGVLSPMHPLLVWHYAEYARVIRDQKTLLDKRDQDLVRGEFNREGIPFFFASIGVPRVVGDMASLPFSGRIGGLPQFSRGADARDPRDGLGPVRRLIEAFVALHPAAAEGLRLVLLEPPDSGHVLSLLCQLAEAGTLRGVHVTVLRRSGSLGAELNLSGDDERRVQQLFGNHVERRFTFEVRRVGEGLALPAGLAPHVAIVFDQTARDFADAGAVPHRVQPLANRRRLVYRIATRNVDLEPALGGLLAGYSSLAKLALGTKIDSYQTIHQDAALSASMQQVATQVPWFVVADGHVDRDLDLSALRVLTDREGTRDVVAFTKSPAAFRRTLRDVVRQFNTAVTDEKLDALLEELSSLLDAGLLSLRPSRTGDVVQSHVRGLLGLMVGVQALRTLQPATHDRMILSLDSDQARRWLHLGDDPHRADLLIIDAADEGFWLTVVEVKTRQDTSNEYAIQSGVATGSAMDQMLSTYGLLAQVFDREQQELLVTPSRREILREHLYRELSKGTYDSAARKRWATRSQMLFEGALTVDLRCTLVEVHLGVAKASLSPTREAVAKFGDVSVPVTVMDLNEDGVGVLVNALEPLEITNLSEPDEPAPELSPVNPCVGGVVEPNATSPVAEAPPPEPTILRPRVLLGVASSPLGQNREIWFDPAHPDQGVSNPHLSISGETGSGKTQAAKALLHEFSSLGLPSLILDFKDDYSRPDYAVPEGFAVHDANFGSLPFNPMIPPIDPQSGMANPIGHVHELANMLQRIYKLGDQQVFTLREAMKELYEIAGVGTRPFTPNEDQQYLPFEAVRDVLIREDATSLLGRLSPIFDLGLFSYDEASGLDDLLARSAVIRLSQLPGDQVKNAVAEFFLMALYGYLIRRPHPQRLTRLLVLDEAWRLVNSPFLEPLMREGRAFGLGVIVATQFPKDLPDHISGSTATRLYFNQTKADQVREIQRTLVGKTSGQEADHVGQVVRGLAPLECLIQNRQYAPWTKLRVSPYFERVADERSS